MDKFQDILLNSLYFLFSQILPELEREVIQNEQRFKDLDSITKLDKKRESLMHMAAWSQVAAEEKVIKRRTIFVFNRC